MRFANSRLAAHLVTGLFVLAWGAAAARLPVYLLPGPLDVGKRLLAFLGDPQMLLHAAISLGHVLAAIAVSFLIGFALALLAWAVPVTALAIQGRISPFLNSFSGIAWALLAVLWFGLDDTTVIFAVVMVLIPFAIINLSAGLASLDAELVEMALSFGRGRLGRFRRLVLPTLYPYMLSTLRISFGVAWKVSLTAELFGGDAGFGYLFNTARQDYDTPLLAVVILLIIAFVYGVDRFLLGPLQARVAARYHEV